jgi:hypothetical protein
MNHEKPKLVIQERGRKTCPVCGKSSYSRDGIHPQCAIQQSDAPRQLQLQAEKRQALLSKKPPRQKSWNRKCPHCHVEVHIRRKVCDCGYKFEAP